MNTLTEDHLIYNIASYLRMPCMLQFATTNKRFHECIHGNDQLWNGGKDCKSWAWYPLNITSNDIFNAKPALERHAAHSKTPYRDLYLQLGKAEKEFLISYLSIFVPTAARSSSGGGGEDNITPKALYEWTIMIDEIIAKGDYGTLKLYYKILTYLNYRRRGRKQYASAETGPKMYTDRLLRVVEKLNLNENLQHFIWRRRLTSTMLTRHLSLITYYRNRRVWIVQGMQEDHNYSNPVTVMRGNDLFLSLACYTYHITSLISMLYPL